MRTVTYCHPLAAASQHSLVILFSFDCNEGFILLGSATSSCDYFSNFTFAEWSHRAPVCDRKLVY